MSRKTCRAVVVPDVLLDVLDLETAVVTVIERGERRNRVVLRRRDGFRHHRVHAVGADDDPGVLHHRRAAAPMPRDACDSPLVPEELVDAEPLTQLDAAFDRGIDQQLVEDRPAGTEPAASLVGVEHAAFEREGPDVERHLQADWRAAGGGEPREQPPPVEDLGAVRPDDVRGHRVAWKRRLVHEQDPVALAGQQHRGWRARATGADDDRVVHVHLRFSHDVRADANNCQGHRRSPETGICQEQLTSVHVEYTREERDGMLKSGMEQGLRRRAMRRSTSVSDRKVGRMSSPPVLICSRALRLGPWAFRLGHCPAACRASAYGAIDLTATSRFPSARLFRVANGTSGSG